MELGRETFSNLNRIQMGEVVTSTADEHRQQDGEIAIPYSGEIHYDYDHYSSHRKLIRFEIPPRRSYHFARQFRTNTTTGILSGNNFLKGIKWSPDGSCLLTCSDDNSLHIFARYFDPLILGLGFLKCFFLSNEDLFWIEPMILCGDLLLVDVLTDLMMLTVATRLLLKCISTIKVELVAF